MFNPTISLYQGVKDTKGTEITVTEAFLVIASDDLSNQIFTIVHELNDKKRTALKTKLPAVTWSGSFSSRKAEKLIQHSGLLCLDFDKISAPDATKNILIESAPDFLYAVFVSPSGNGLKVLCRIPQCTIEEHGQYFRVLADFFEETFQLKADESGKDVSRLCFLSWDTSIWISEHEPTPYVYSQAEEKKAASSKKTKPQYVKLEAKSSEVNFDDLRAFTDKKFTYAEGSRNQYVNAFVMNCKTHGQEQSDTDWYCQNAFGDYIAEHGVKDLQNIIKSVYANQKIEFGKFRKQHKGHTQAQTKATAPKREPERGEGLSEYNEQILFWYEVEKPDKETGEMKVEHKFDHDGLTYFLANNGFRKVRLGEKGFQFVRLFNGLIEAVEPDDINHFVMLYLHKDVKPGKGGIYHIDEVQDHLYQVRRMYKRGVNTYTKTALYASLPELKPKFLRDTETTAYLYFENGYVEVTAKERKLHPYTDLTSNIWSKQRKRFEIALLPKEEIEKSVVWQFINMAILGNGNDDKKDAQRLGSMITTIGYLLDTYKDPTNTKAPVFQDRKPNSGTEANGGSGKTLTAHMIGKMINTCLIDGKGFSFDAPYPYDTFRVDQKLIVYNDVNKRFPFESLFHKITEDFQFDRRYVDAIVIPHEDAPKHLVITNYSLTGDGSSHRRRQHIIEFSDYFNDEHTPKDEFKHRFFIDWDNAEWNRFYNFMIFCVQEFKFRGLIPFPAQNVKMNKLLNEAGEEFIDWMDYLFIGSSEAKPIRTLTRNPKDELFTVFKDDVKRWSKLENTNKFTNWVKLWADMRGFYMQVDKSGRTYYWTFVEKTVK